MDIVHIAYDDPGRLREVVSTNATQIVLHLEPIVHVVHPDFDPTTMEESVITLAQFYRANLTRSRIDVLKHVTMNRL